MKYANAIVAEQRATQIKTFLQYYNDIWRAVNHMIKSDVSMIRIINNMYLEKQTWFSWFCNKMSVHISFKQPASFKQPVIIQCPLRIA